MAWFGGSSSRRSSHSSRHGSSSYYGRRPRDGYIQRILYQLKRIFRDLVYYAKKHPVKVFMLVIMPLVTGGALTSVLRQFGIRLPPSLFGGMSGGRGFGGSSSSFGSSGGGLMNSFGGGAGGVQGLMKMAQMFM
ncbi:MAG: hypothetical protein M1827_000826 [Pycnora praestabilis]|nr:MAG: hypothetical protein M1827_000826 [Pycnora praestabilis]